MTTNSTLIQNVTPEELAEILRPIIKQELSFIQLKESATSYLTRQQAAELLHITLPTLHEYTKAGVIQGSRIGTRILYCEQAIQDAVKTIPVLKYKRSR